jgi:hypothetical protein
MPSEHGAERAQDPPRRAVRIRAGGVRILGQRPPQAAICARELTKHHCVGEAAASCDLPIRQARDMQE